MEKLIRFVSDGGIVVFVFEFVLATASGGSSLFVLLCVLFVLVEAEISSLLFAEFVSLWRC